MTHPSPTYQPVAAAFWMGGAMVSFSVMAVAGRELAAQLDTFEIMLYRSLIGFVIVIFIAKFANTLHQIDTTALGLHFFRNVAHFTGQNLWLYAVALIPLSQLFAFEFSTPLWVALLAPLVLGESLTRSKSMALALGFVGILIVARPSVDTLSPGIIAAAFCAVGFAGTFLTTKLLSRTQSITCIMFWLATMQALFALIISGFDGQIALPRGVGVLSVLLIGVCGLLAHFCITKAVTLAPATVVAPLDFMRLPLIAVVGYFIYQEPLDAWVFFGATLVFVANYLNIRSNGSLPVSSSRQ